MRWEMEKPNCFSVRGLSSEWNVPDDFFKPWGETNRVLVATIDLQRDHVKSLHDQIKALKHEIELLKDKIKSMRSAPKKPAPKKSAVRKTARRAR